MSNLDYIDTEPSHDLDFDQRLSLVEEFSGLAQALESFPLGRNSSFRRENDDYNIIGPFSETLQSTLFYGRSEKEVNVIIKKYEQDSNTYSFERERFIQNRLGRHNHILPAIEFIEDAGHKVSIHPYVPGRNLEEVIENEGPLSVRRVVSLFKQLCPAVAYTNQHGIVNRNINPANILVARADSGEVVSFLLDFGISWISELAHLGDAMAILSHATPEYMAPEKWSLLTPEPREDVYALAATAYHLASGQTPHQLDPNNLSADLYRIHSQLIPPRQLKIIKPDVPQKFNDAVMRGLAYDLKEIFQTPEELGEALTKSIR